MNGDEIVEMAMPAIRPDDRSKDQRSKTRYPVLPTMRARTEQREEESIVKTIAVSNLSDASVPSDISSDGDRTVAVCKPVALPMQQHVRSFPSDIKIVQVGERRWMCDKCKAAVFDNFVEACMHEMTCQCSSEDVNMHDPSPVPVPVAARVPALGSFSMSNSTQSASAISTRPKAPKNEVALEIILVPEKEAVLSDYNYILTQNIEFYETPTSYSTSTNVLSMTDLPSSKIGLRCIHCSSGERHVTAASFFPSAIASISSGMGTIGARHFLGGKCTSFPKETFDSLAAAKKTSQQQTRMQGKLGLDAYCRQLAKSQKIFDLEVGGIFIATKRSTQEESRPMEATMIEVKPVEQAPSSASIALVATKPAPAPKDTLPDRNDPSAFIEGSIENFWECKHCNSLPFHWRASGSVVFCATAPTIDLVGKHLSACLGKKPLRIPRNASIKIKNSGDPENGPSVLVRWDSDEGKRKSGRIKRQSLGPESSKKKKKAAAAAATVTQEALKPGVDATLLAFPDDHALTTDFAHFTVLQLKKCYLNKAGGSRGNCPLGYPGLACAHCAGTTSERRFFYTSSDHLRNSFSHIPSHLVTCSKCPVEVKEKIEEFKAIRSKQKSLLKVGDHKIFIDHVWGRLHGPGGGVIEVPEENYAIDDVSDDDRSSSSGVSIEFQCNPHDDYLTESLDGRYLESKEISIETSKSFILSSSDRKAATDYVYYSLLQMTPKQYSVDSDGFLSDLKQDETKDKEGQVNTTKREEHMQALADPVALPLTEPLDETVAEPVALPLAEPEENIETKLSSTIDEKEQDVEE